ncbi:Transcription factor bHLH147 [Striga hermonthica]|uniref:Transcription factor bHLH147 n=1 Tax=Striga hermonthica TaxID=68872 RepID=A0A9N7RFE2_STRHE|nr:Transcription factor bHLH147 [Striga hermonthica]
MRGEWKLLNSMADMSYGGGASKPFSRLHDAVLELPTRYCYGGATVDIEFRYEPPPASQEANNSRVEFSLRAPGKWKTADEQRIYSSRLADALRSFRPSDSTAVAVRDAADRVLAVSSRGRTRWSRALMTRRLGLRLSQIRRKHRRAARPDAGPRKPASQGKLPLPLQRKARAL